jgi:3-oxoacyl-[acyl-carrier-protein] synthase-1
MPGKRVFITGMGIISAIGTGVQETLVSLRNNASGIGSIEIVDTLLRSKLIAGEIKVTNEKLAAITGVKKNIYYTRTSLLGIAALQEAIQMSKLDPSLQKTGFINATTVGGMSDMEKCYFDLVDPTTKSNENGLADCLDCADCTEKIADHFNIKDWIATISTACSSSANAILYGARLIKSGQLDVAVCGGTDALTRFTLNGFNSLKNIDQSPCMPFDENRNGLNLGEAAAYVILESEDQLQRSGNKPLAELSGFHNFNEAFHPTAPSPNGEGALQAMQATIQMAGLQPADISYINVHGTATLNNDLSEGIALKRLFGENVPFFSSTKPFTGHTLAAAGSVEAVFSILSLQEQIVYANLNFKSPIPELDLYPVTSLQTDKPVAHVLSNSFGFGGNNASLLFSKYV